MTNIKAGTYRFNDVLSVPNGALTQNLNLLFTFETYCTNADGTRGRITGKIRKIIVNPVTETDGKKALTMSFADADTSMFVYAYVNGEQVNAAGTVLKYSFDAYVSDGETHSWETPSDVFWGAIEGTSFGNVVEKDDPFPWKMLYLDYDTSVTDAFGEWFINNTNKISKTIKAGTYRFNKNIIIPADCNPQRMRGKFDFDISSYEDGQGGHQLYVEHRGHTISFTDNPHIYINGYDFNNTIVYENGQWKTDPISKGVRDITIRNDEDVTPDFYAAFVANTKHIMSSVKVSDFTDINSYTTKSIMRLYGNKSSYIKCAGKLMTGDLQISLTAEKPFLQEKTATMNGEIIPDDGFDGLSKVTVAVGNAPVLQEKIVNKNGTYTADQGFDALRSVTVNVPAPLMQEKTMTENGNVLPDEGYDGLSKVTVNVAPILQEKTVYENGWVYSDMGYDGLSAVNVEVPMPRYYGGEVEVLS